MLLLSLDGVTKQYGPEPVLEGVSFELRPGDKVGLVGPNGVGKTTLLKILAGREEADRGKIEWHGSARVGYLEQQPEFPPGKTLWELAYLGLESLVNLRADLEAAAADLALASDERERERLAARYDRLQYQAAHHDAYELDHRVERILHGLGFTNDSFQQPAEVLSGGQKNRLLLAQLLLAEPQVMLLDEPSNHLDVEATTWLEDLLAEIPAALIVVSHDRYLLDRITNRTFELFQGTIDAYAGNFSAYWKQKAQRMLVAERTFEKQQEFIARTEEFIRRNHYGQKHLQAEDRRKKLERLERVSPPRQIHGPVMGFPPADRTGDIVLRVEELSKGFGRPLFEGLSFDILRGTRWGVLGPNGTGKTTLLRCIVGEYAADSGRVILGTGVRIGYADQLLAALDPATPVVEAIRPPRKEFTEPQRRDLLARFGLRGDLVFQPVASLSGGERSRAALARVSAGDANFLILDEPTNHLDLWARDALEASLVNFGGTVLFVSHDRYFVNRVADHLLVVEPGRFRVIEGNYDTYRHLVRQGLAGADPERPQAQSDRKTKAAPQTQRKKRRFPYRKVADLEAEIFEIEARVSGLRESLGLPEVYRDGDRVRQARAKIAELEASLAQLYEHWEDAAG
jgi:ATP-binding cassette subfamily F protein 3